MPVDWSPIDIALRSHADQLRDLFARWQLLESKAAAVVTSAGVLVAAAVLLQTTGEPGFWVRLMSGLAALAGTFSIGFAAWSYRLKEIVAPPSSFQVQKALTDLLGLNDKDHRIADLVGTLGEPWDRAIKAMEGAIPEKAFWIRWAQRALLCSASLTALGLLVRIFCPE